MDRDESESEGASDDENENEVSARKCHAQKSEQLDPEAPFQKQNT